MSADQELLNEFKEYRNDFNRWTGGKSGSLGGGAGDNGPSANTSFDKSTAKIVTALGILNSNVVNASRSYRERVKDVEKFTRYIDKATDAVEKKHDADVAAANATKNNTVVAKDEAKARRETAAELKREIREKQENNTATAYLTEKYKLSAEASLALEKGLGLSTEALKTFANGMSDYIGNLNKGQRGMATAVKPATDTLSTFVDGLTTATQIVMWVHPAFKGLGTAAKLVWTGFIELAGWLGKKFPKAIEASAEQLDGLYKAYGELSKVGGAAAGGLDAERKSAPNLGFT